MWDGHLGCINVANHSENLALAYFVQVILALYWSVLRHASLRKTTFRNAANECYRAGSDRLGGNKSVCGEEKRFRFGSFDYRRFNSLSKQKVTQIPYLKKFLDFLCEAAVCSSLDVAADTDKLELKTKTETGSSLPQTADSTALDVAAMWLMK